MKKTYTIKNFAKRLVMVLTVGLLAVNAWGTTATWTYKNGSDDLSDKSPFTVTYGDGGASTSTQVSGSGDNRTLRLYASRSNGNGGWVTFTAGSGYQITAIQVVFTQNRTYAQGKIDNGSWTSAFTGNSNTVTVSDLTASSYSIKNGQNSGSSNNNVFIASITITYGSTCSNSMTISKGTGTNCSFTLGTSGSGIASCSGVSTTVTVSPTAGYGNPSVTQSGASAAPTISGSGNNWTVSYGNNTTGTSTINVSCSANDYTVTLDDDGGSGGSGSKTVTYNANTNLTTSVAVPTKAHHDFGGYYTAKDGGGTQLVNADGSWKASVSTYTDGSKNWIKASGVTLYAKWTEHDLINYRTVCCTPIATVSGAISVGSINETGGTATWSWSGSTTGISKNILKVYNTSDVLVKTIDNISASATSQSIAGLDPCTSYYVTLTTVASSSTYCEGAEQGKSSNFTTNGWAVHYTGGDATEGALLSNVTKVTGASQACLSEDYVATFTANTGYKLPDNIVVYIAGVEVDVDDAYTWSVSNGTGTLTVETDDLSEEIDVRIIGECVSPVVTVDPEDANYYVDDSPDALSVTATLASGTRTYLWKVSTDGGSNWSNATGTNNTASYSGASLSTASTGTIKFKCIVGNSEGGCDVESGVATITISYPPYFPNGKTIFIQAESTSAWTGDGCVMAWFHTSGGSEEAQETYWLFDATGGDAGKKLFATVVPASGNLPYLDIQRFASDCSTWWNKNGGCSYADASGSNTVRSTGKHDTSSDGDYIRWNGSGVTIDLYGDPSGDEWASSLASFSDQGAGVWTATYSNYAPADAEGESQNFKAKTNYNGWIGNTNSNNNATLDGMHVGSTYNITATLDVTDHSLTMSKEFVKGTVHFDLQGHGLAISDYTNVTAGSKISAPSDPSATGWTFGGWYKEPACTNAWTFASDEVEETMTLYAKWTVNVYTITANLTGTSVNTAFPSSFTYTGSTTTDLNRTFSVNTTNYFMPSSVSVTMGGETQTEGSGKDYTYNSSTGAFTFDKIITGNIVITATATAKLQSIAITTQPTTRKYFAGESFSSTGAVVTATMGDGSTKAVTASATWTPSGTLSAGASQTVTATYTEAGIEKTATTTIDVYSVTVNKVNEDGDGVSADGVSAGWTLGTKALAASATSASKYVFKQWEVTGASIGSTSSANTNLSSPTANVVVNAVFYKPRVIKWSVNGNDSYETGDPTTTVAYNGTISDVPTDPSGLACASTFIAWTDATHNNGQTAKASDSYYGSALYTDAGDFPNITAATTTFYAVFAEVPDEYYWSMGTIDQLTTGSGYATYDGEHTVKGSDGNNYTYTSQNVMSNSGNQFRGSSYCGRIYNTTSLGRITRIVLDYSAYAGQMKVYESDSEISSSGTTALTPSISDNRYTYNCSGKGYFIVIQEGSNAAKANVTVYFGDAPYNYVTECDPNIVAVTYNANSGSTSCTNTTTDKTEDFTVCSSAPTRDYYSFDGWLCSADDEVYAASATIAAAAIDADFTLTAQWTPVPYTITYELDGGTNHGSNPASYNVETSTITLQDPTREHDRFDGWYDNSSFTGDAVTSIPVGSHGNVTLYAKWAERYEIIFDADGTKTTIYRADDEDLSASVAGQGSVPDDPDAPSACSSKVFVGWSESEIDDETDTKPSDLMKSAVGTVDEDKEFHAVWAIVTPTDPPVTYAGTGVFEEITSMGDLETGTYYVLYGYEGESTHGALKNAGSGTAGEEAGTNMTVSTSSITNPSTDIVWKLGGTTDAYTLYNQSASKYIEITTDDAKGFALNASATTSYKVTVEDGHGFFFKTNKTGCTRGISIFTSTSFRCYALASAKNLRLFKLPTNTVTAYCTSCCATKVTLSQNSPEHGTVEFAKSTLQTCDEDKNVSMTITPAAGYQLTGFTVATGDGKVAPKEMSADVSTNDNSNAAQNITLTFAEDANGAYDVTATFGERVVTGWTWTYDSGDLPDPIDVYVGQKKQIDVAYTPSGLLATHTNKDSYDHDVNTNPNIGSPVKAAAYFTFKGVTAIDATSFTLTHKDGPTQTVNVRVLALPKAQFVDNVHNESFADVVATVDAGDLTVTTTKTTPTHADFDGSAANTCEEQHLHLVGWIDGAWPAYAAYMAGTGDKPSESAIVGATGYFYLPGASIDLVAKDGHTYYAIWAKVE